MIKVNYTAQKKLLLNFQNSQMKKRGETLFGECISQKFESTFFKFSLYKVQRKNANVNKPIRNEGHMHYTICRP